MRFIIHKTTLLILLVLLSSFIGCATGAKYIKNPSLLNPTELNKTSIICLESKINNPINEVLLYIKNIKTNKKHFVHFNFEKEPLIWLGSQGVFGPEKENAYRTFYYSIPPGDYLLDYVSVNTGKGESKIMSKVKIMQDTITLVPDKISYLGTYDITVERSFPFKFLKEFEMQYSDSFSVLQKKIPMENFSNNHETYINLPLKIKAIEWQGFLKIIKQ